MVDHNEGSEYHKVKVEQQTDERHLHFGDLPPKLHSQQHDNAGSHQQPGSKGMRFEGVFRYGDVEVRPIEYNLGSADGKVEGDICLGLHLPKVLVGDYLGNVGLSHPFVLTNWCHSYVEL